VRIAALADDLDAVVHYRTAKRLEAGSAADEAARLQAQGLSAAHLIGNVERLLARVGEADGALARLLDDVADALAMEAAGG